MNHRSHLFRCWRTSAHCSRRLFRMSNHFPLPHSRTHRLHGQTHSGWRLALHCMPLNLSVFCCCCCCCCCRHFIVRPLFLQSFVCGCCFFSVSCVSLVVFSEVEKCWCLFHSCYCCPTPSPIPPHNNPCVSDCTVMFQTFGSLSLIQSLLC